MRLRTMKMKQISDTTLKITMSLEDFDGSWNGNRRLFSFHRKKQKSFSMLFWMS